jgi:uncharacterized Zn finger protein (UPF0148 family)
MSAKHKCQVEVWNRYHYRSYPCGRTAKAEKDGKHYCGIHDPAKVDAKRAEREARYAEQKNEWRLQSAAPDMLEALQKIMDAAEKSSFQAVGLLYLREVAGPAIRKAIGEKA